MKKYFILIFSCFLLEDCVSGLEIRLTNQLGLASGSSPLYGYVESLINGIWTPICADGWQNGSQVICRMLGYATSSYSLSSSYRTCIYNISCTGTERSLEECMNGIGYQSSPYSELAYVRCGSGNKTSSDRNLTGLGVRLVGAANTYEGIVQLFAGNQWMNIYAPNNTWSDKEAAVVCRTMGFSTSDNKGFKLNLLNNMRCSGQETSLNQCVYNTVDCRQGNVVSIRCGCYASGCNFGYCNIAGNRCVSACLPGSYYTGYCEPCSVGMYQPLQHQYSCYLCPSGTYQSSPGQTACIACPSGTYQAKAGQTSCDICLPGTYQNQLGQTSCNPCPAGTYQYWSGQKSCIACDFGTYQNYSGQVVCLHCGKGKTTDRPGSDTYSECHDEQLTEQDDHINHQQRNMVIMGGSLMIVIAVVNIVVCIFILKRTCLKAGTLTTRISKLSLTMRRTNEYVSENPGEEQYEVCERH
ncbi:hypothetical protein CHS0354_021361 [Potamilus streckersoni]|uniref:SRCR domain-containing protein n=1 Tax=Potamilus streckersoni TaxID=2493646 RepID=A0AAE0S3E9_9BIVA|nr:hypothetical protein CHS0354_021361 [Potamilus streckersoni]